jgi:hypothetical protein
MNPTTSHTPDSAPAPSPTREQIDAAYAVLWPNDKCNPTLEEKRRKSVRLSLQAALAQVQQVAPSDAGAAQRHGLSIAQEPKYTVNGHAIVNRASGEEIPADEPAFIFRARDVHAREALEAYAAVLTPGMHRDAVAKRVADFARFAYAFPERMKEPDTAPAQPEPTDGGKQS